jgi:hypothetical protein
VAKELVLDVVARKNSKDLQLLAEEFQKLSMEAEKSGKSLQKTASFSKFLEDQTAKTRAELAKLRSEFQKTGDLKIAGDIGGLEKNLKSLEALSKRFATSVETGITDGGKSGLRKLIDNAKSETKAFTKEFEGGWLKALFTTPTGLAAVAGGAVLLGNAIGGAVLTGIGLAGIGSGIAIALHDPKVKPALEQLKTDVGSGLKGAAEPFVGELQQGLGILDRGFGKSLPGIKDTFAQLAPEVTTLTHGLSGFLGPVVTGLEHAAIAAKPLVDEFSNNFLPALGKNLGSLFDTMAANSKEAEGGLRALEDTINDTVIVTRDLIPVLAKVGDVLQVGTTGGLEDFTLKLIYGQQALDAYHSTAPGLAVVADDLTASFKKAAQVTADLNYHQDDLRSTSQAVADAEARLTAQFDDQVNKLLALENADDAYQKGLNDLKDALSQHSHTLQGNSDAAIQNRQAIRDLIGEAEQARQAAIDHAGGVNASSDAIKAANDQYEQNIQKLEQMGQKLGLTKQDLDAIIGEYNIDINVRTHGTQVTHINSDGSISVGNIKAFAAGGRYEKGVPRLVGENGPEIDIPDHSGVIVPNLPPPASFPTRSAATGGMVINLTVNAGVASPRDVADQVLEALQYAVVGRGGNVQMAVTGRAA